MGFISICLYLLFFLGGLLHRASWWPVIWTLVAFFPLVWLVRQSVVSHEMESLFLAGIGGFVFGLIAQGLRVSWQRTPQGGLVVWPVVFVLGGPILMIKDYGLVDLTLRLAQTIFA